MDNPNSEKNTQGWFERLEAESWSAELIISGAAIYGSFQLPSALNQLINYSLLHFSDDILRILYLVYTYLTLAITILMVNFVMHFVLRSLWVGLIGLASAYPQGVNIESKSFSKSYLQQLKADFGDLRAYNEKIDKACSIIFAFSFSVAMIFMSIAVIVLAAAGLAYLLHQLSPKIGIQTSFFSILGLIVLPSLFGGVLNLKPLREKAWVQKIHYPFMIRRIGRLMFHVFYQPVYYINSIFTTNFNKGQYSMRVLAYMTLILPVFFMVFTQSNAMYADKDFYFKNTNREDRFYARHYEDQLKQDQLILNPLIPSAEISGAGLRLFLPMPMREEVVLYKKYGKPPVDSTLNESKLVYQNRIWFKEQARKYFHIAVNGKKINPELRSYQHPNATEYGFLAFVPANLFVEGENVLHVQSEYKVESKKRESFIPFWYSVK
ncbi:hypothetical protein [Haliscomenobacter sp.]|uniref:hypothetical protein n=1 Tax=Haliscomenobacter sp. TaxID=2717303 RepID=UPI0035930F5E